VISTPETIIRVRLELMSAGPRERDRHAA